MSRRAQTELRLARSLRPGVRHRLRPSPGVLPRHPWIRGRLRVRRPTLLRRGRPWEARRSTCVTWTSGRSWTGTGDDGQLLSVAIATTDAEALFLEYVDAGVEFQERLQAKPWGAEEFVIRDPDGNLIVLGSPPAEPALLLSGPAGSLGAALTVERVGAVAARMPARDAGRATSARWWSRRSAASCRGDCPMAPGEGPARRAGCRCGCWTRWADGVGRATRGDRAVECLAPLGATPFFGYGVTVQLRWPVAGGNGHTSPPVRHGMGRDVQRGSPRRLMTRRLPILRPRAGELILEGGRPLRMGCGAAVLVRARPPLSRRRRRGPGRR